LNDKHIFALADQVQKQIQEKQPYFRLIKRRDEIEKKLEAETESRRYRINKKS
jgi:tetrahydromethanopterin S-methyltransferase subunit G